MSSVIETLSYSVHKKPQSVAAYTTDAKLLGLCYFTSFPIENFTENWFFLQEEKTSPFSLVW